MTDEGPAPAPMPAAFLGLFEPYVTRRPVTDAAPVTSAISPFRDSVMCSVLRKQGCPAAQRFHSASAESKASGVPSGRASSERSMRLTSPVSTLPGPHSMTCGR